MSKQASSTRAHGRAAARTAANPAAEALLAAPPAAESPDPYRVGDIRFMHLAEAEFARLLNYYQVAWEYEPREFALEWDGDRVVRQFRPDFYLPEYDLYIELTVMKQSLVRRKNRKLRLLRALYPDVQIKLLYRRDFHRLLQGFGLPPSSIEPGARPHAA